MNATVRKGLPRKSTAAISAHPLCMWPFSMLTEHFRAMTRDRASQYLAVIHSPFRFDHDCSAKLAPERISCTRRRDFEFAPGLATPDEELTTRSFLGAVVVIGVERREDRLTAWPDWDKLPAAVPEFLYGGEGLL